MLATIGFSVQLPEVVFEGKDVPGNLKFCDVVSDPFLLWHFQSGRLFTGRKINQMGFREREVDPVKQPGRQRIASELDQKICAVTRSPARQAKLTRDQHE